METMISEEFKDYIFDFDGCANQGDVEETKANEGKES